MSEKKKSIYKEWWFYLVIAVLVFVVWSLMPSSADTGLDTFAQCLDDKGVVMYGTDWCPHCQNQKKLFGSSFDYIEFVDCDYNKEECLRNLVNGYPTWKINGQNYAGEQPLEALASYSGCELVYDS